MSDNFKKYIENISQDFIPVIDSEFVREDYIAIDLSAANVDLNTINVSSSSAFEVYIKEYIAQNRGKVAYGGYNEARAIYSRSSHFNQHEPETERNIHLGLDLWIEANTPIFAPLNGTIHSFKNNTNHGDYGPTIILKHNIEGFEFFTLYGHLSLASIDNLQVGVEVKQGEQIATLGTAKVNGDYPPHLHFQVIKDIQDFVGDYPGVSNQLDLEFYKTNCPDPNLLLGLG